MDLCADMHTDNGDAKVAVHVSDHGVQDGACATTSKVQRNDDARLWRATDR